MKTANIYAGIVKMDENADGTLTVFGKATDDSLDIDQQICDPVWLDKAMPEWFMTGGNIREQHSNIAAGVAEEYEKKSDGHYITALVVDPVSVKKVKARVLKGFSIGIKSPRVVRDTKAVNGRIVDGQIVEVSLVDRPANPNAKLILAKSAAGQKDLVKTEELVEKHGDHDQADHNPNTGGSGSGESEKPTEGGGSEIPGGRNDAHVNDVESAISDSALSIDNLVDEDSDDFIDDLSEDDENLLYDAQEEIAEAESALRGARDAENDGQHLARIDEAMTRLDEASTALRNADNRAMNAIANEIDDHYDELEAYFESFAADKTAVIKNRKEESLMKERKSRARKSAQRKEAEGMPMNGEAKAVPSREEMTERYASARKALDEVTAMCKEYGYGDIEKQYGETAEEETAEGPAVGAETAEEEVGEARGEKPVDKEVVVEPNEMADKSTTKCLECGCNMVGNDHGGGQITLPDGTTSNMTTAEMVTEKSTITPLPTIETVGTQIEEEDSDESDSADKSLLADVNLNDIIEKAVKSAMTAVKAQVAELKSAKEAVENKASQLETELATAKSLAIGGGPKRTTIATGAKTNNELLAKAESYRAKAAATTDPILAKGYRDLAKDFASKATEVESK